jgi:hypothetical protein
MRMEFWLACSNTDRELSLREILRLVVPIDNEGLELGFVGVSVVCTE